ncbi:MAG: HAMP domain-containing sensor histidine kinase [Pirellulales bacterium]
MIFEWVEADRGCVLLMDEKTGTLRPRVRRDRKNETGLIIESDDDDTMSISRTILDFVTQRREGVLSSNARDDQRFDAAASIVRHGVREAICVPMQGRYGMVGAIYIDTKIPASKTLTHGSRKFSEDHLKLMVAIGHQAALAVEDTNYYSAMVRSERLAAMGQTIAFLSHHIKNILQGIKGGGYLIQMGLDGHDEPLIGKGWDIVERNQKRISNMVLDMLTFSKEREPEFAAGDLNKTVAEVVELVQPRTAEKGIVIDWSPDLRLPQLMFDDEGLHRAILNIASNAVDAVEERLAAEAEDPQTRRPDDDPPRVKIRAVLSRDARNVRIEIDDSGPGIAAERIAGIFNLFESSKGMRGTGLGLPVSQKILREHGGQIQIESEVGRGTRFVLEFPARLSDAMQTREMPTRHDAGQGVEVR